MKIAIAGYGIEGESNYRYWNTSDNQVVIIDERQPSREVPIDASIIVGDDAFARLDGYDLVVRTAGLAPRKLATDGKIWSATNEFFDKCPAPIIGVTGSKGKGTTCSLITSILRASGKTVHLVGNIGVPALDVLSNITSEDIVVYELSSFQLWDLEKSPQVAVVLMIEPDHLDVHENMEDYLNAKANIRRHQTCDDICLYHPTNEYSRRVATVDTGIYSSVQAAGEQKDAVCRYGISDDYQVYVKNAVFMVRDTAICPIGALQLPGGHNIENACAAISAVLALVPVSKEAIEQGLRDFTGLPHRLKFVREVKGVKYYDDSIATTPGSAIAAMKAFDQPKIMILGGSNKGADYTELAAVTAETNVKSALLIGDESDTLETALRLVNVECYNLGSALTMSDIVDLAHRQATEGDIVILSPACASFGMFKNYSDRGDQFVRAVENLGTK
jgi:UDP-N-acetylmuramoylalanine--D-glutamate ligase